MLRNAENIGAPPAASTCPTVYRGAPRLWTTPASGAFRRTGSRSLTQTLDSIAAKLQSIAQAQDDENIDEEYEDMYRRLGGGGHR